MSTPSRSQATSATKCRTRDNFFIDDPEDMIKRVIVEGRQWEALTLELCKKHIEPNSVVVEVGAHIGSHTVPISRPGRPMGPRLRVRAATKAIPRATSQPGAERRDQRRAAEIRDRLRGGQGHRNESSPARQRRRHRRRHRRRPGGASKPRQASASSAVSVLKIDVEGYENEVLAGASETIRQNRPVILIEIAGGHWYEGGATRSPGSKYTSPGGRSRGRGGGGAFDYTVKHLRANAYIGLPNETSQDSSVLPEVPTCGTRREARPCPPGPSASAFGRLGPRDGKTPSPR